MEIVDYLRIARQRLRILVTVPLLAGVITAAAVFLMPQVHIGTAVVGAPALVGGAPTNQYTGSQAVSQFVAAFTAAADSPVVLQRVADQTRQSIRDIDENVSVVPIGTSAIMRVSYRSRNADVADDVAQAAATETLHYLFGSQVELAKREIDQAEAELDAINKEIAKLAGQAGTIDAAQLYADKLQQISTLQVRQNEFSALGQSSAAASMAAAISTRKKELSELAPKVQQFQKLTAQADATKAALVTLRQNFSAAQAQADAAAPERAVTPVATHAEDRIPVLLRKIGPAIGAGLFLALGLVVVLELLGHRRTLPAVGRGRTESDSLVPSRV